MKSFLEFTLDHQTFYEGDDIVSDFWIDSKTPEPECRAACVATPGCKGWFEKEMNCCEKEFYDND